MINIYVLISLAITLIVLTTFIVYILPWNIKEVRQYTSDKLVYWMRVIILSITLSILLFSVLPVVYQVTRIDMVTEVSLQNFAGLSSALRTLSFGVGWIGIHVIADILIRRDSKKEE